MAIEEYKTVREESLGAVARSQAIAQYGLATAGVGVTAGVLAAQRNATLGAVVLCGLIPLAGCFGAAMMAVEAQRSARAGWYLRGLEQRINLLVPGGAPPLGWETLLRDPTHRVRGYREATAVVVVAAVLLSAGLGGYVLGSHGDWVGLAVALAANVLLFLMLGAWTRSVWQRLEWYQRCDDLQARPPWAELAASPAGS